MQHRCVCTCFQVFREVKASLCPLRFHTNKDLTGKDFILSLSLKQLLNKRFQLLVKINKINSASVDSAASNLQNKENCIHSDSAYSHERVVLLCWGDLCFPPNWTQRCCCFYWSELLLCWCCWQKAIHKQSAQTWKRKTGLSFFLGSFFFSSSSDPPHPHVLSKGTVLHDQFHLCVSYRHRCRACLA